MWPLVICLHRGEPPRHGAARAAGSLAARSSTCVLLRLTLFPLPWFPPALLAPPQTHTTTAVSPGAPAGGSQPSSSQPFWFRVGLLQGCALASLWGCAPGADPSRLLRVGNKRPMKHTAAGDLCWRALESEGVRDHLECVCACTSGFPVDLCAALTCDAHQADMVYKHRPF